MLLKRILLLSLVISLIGGCSSLPSLDQVLPDNRTKYQRSKKLPDLEVPPDLTTEALNDPLTIPDEEDATTLSEFERRKIMRQGGQLSDAEMALLDNSDEKWLAVQGTTSEIWPKLREFWLAKGYQMDLDDAELGVMETTYKEFSVEDVVTHREKFKVFSEEGGTPGSLVLFLSGERQDKIAGVDGSVDWIDGDTREEEVKNLIGELNLHFYGVAAPASSSLSSGSSRSVSTSGPIVRAEILSAGDGKEYLAIPDEFTRAWRNIEDAIRESGMYIDKKDKEKGIYVVLYYAAEEEKEKKGLFSKLAFWKSDEDEGKEFHLSLTGVGDKTEVVVLDEKDAWSDSREASRILSMLQSHYNRILR